MYKNVVVFLFSFTILMATYWVLSSDKLGHLPIAVAQAILITILYRRYALGKYFERSSFFKRLFNKSK